MAGGFEGEAVDAVDGVDGVDVDGVVVVLGVPVVLVEDFVAGW